MAKKDDFGSRIAAAYAAKGAALELGRGVLDGEVHGEAVVQLGAAMANRHGLVAGATGTGKTKTLQLMAEQLSDMGVPVFAADIKGDLSGLTKPGAADDRVQSRIDELGIEWQGSGHPVSFLSLGGLGPASRASGRLVLRAAAAGQGAGRQRDAVVVVVARVPLRRQQGPAPARPRRPARRARLPHE